jgi:D-alanine-D-alanine ligase
MPPTLPLRVAVLYNRTETLAKGEPGDLVADQGVELCAAAVLAALRESGVTVAEIPVRGDVEQATRPYPSREWIIFNLGEGYEGRLFEEARIAWALEAMGYRFTGADGAAMALSTHKARAKEALRRAGVRTPDWRLWRDAAQVSVAALGELAFPLIVKPVAEDASLGITGAAVVRDMAALRERVGYVVERYRQAALVEAFIAGREFNVSLWGDPPELLPLAEIDFTAFSDPTQRIVSFAAKWEEQSLEYKGTPVICPAVVEAPLAARLRETAQRAWEVIGGRGYGRVDIRVGADGVPYVLEVNGNPDLSPDAGFFRAAQAGGYTYAEMALHIVHLAAPH